MEFHLNIADRSSECLDRVGLMWRRSTVYLEFLIVAALPVEAFTRDVPLKLRKYARIFWNWYLSSFYEVIYE